MRSSRWRLAKRGRIRDELAVTRRLELLVVLIGALLAVVAAMTALYVGKPFGTFWDYVTAITWGLVTPTAWVGLGAALNSLGAFTAVSRRFGFTS